MPEDIRKTTCSDCQKLITDENIRGDSFESLDLLTDPRYYCSVCLAEILAELATSSDEGSESEFESVSE